MSWTPGWQSVPVVPAPISGSSLEIAESLFEGADDATSLRQAIAAYQSVPRTEENELELDTRIAEAWVLYGAGYARTGREKADAYESALRHAERAMATNIAFRERVTRGASIAEASAELGLPETEAALLWVTAVSYYFREVLGTPGRILSFRTISQTGPVLERLMELDPRMENGAVPFSLAIYNIARPPWAGRDLERAEMLFEQASEVAPRSLLIPWGRAKYLHSRNGDDVAFRRDLEWVIAQDPRKAATPYAWNVYLQRDARRMLNER